MNATMKLGEAIGYNGEAQMYVRSSGDILSQTASVQPTLMRILGFDREELRYDRDTYITINFGPADPLPTRLFRKVRMV